MTQDIRILLVDDEAAIRKVVRMGLESKGYQCIEAADGASALAKISEFHPHLVLLDLHLPDCNGAELLKSLRKWSRVPVIILTVTDDERITVQLLDAGADDFLNKPFRTEELFARVRVALRNVGLIEATPVFHSDDLEIDFSRRRVSLDGNEVKLTTTEYEVLSRLARDHGKVVPQNLLLRQVWGSLAQDQSHYLRIYVNQIRKKIEKNPSNPKHLVTEPGVGYRLV